MNTAFVQFNMSNNKYEVFYDEKRIAQSRNKAYFYNCFDKKKFKQYQITKLQDIENSVNNVSLEQVAPATDFSINERFDFIESFVEMVANNKAKSLIISGSGGTGKTYTVLKKLTEMNKSENDDFVVYKGYSSAKGLYRILFENKNKIIILDDLDSIFKDATATNLLKAALDSYDKRIITWNVENMLCDDMPKRFEFEGSVIFISNLPINKIPQAVVSRGLRVDLTMSNNEMVERIASVMNTKNFMDGSISNIVKNEVIDFIKKNINVFKDLNIRTAINIVNIRLNQINNWQRLALYMATA